MPRKMSPWPYWPGAVLKNLAEFSALVEFARLLRAFWRSWDLRGMWKSWDYLVFEFSLMASFTLFWIFSGSNRRACFLAIWG